MLRIKLVKSPIGNNKRNRATVQALGLRGVNKVVEHADTPSIRGMIHHVKHMLLVEEVADATPVADAAVVVETEAAEKPARKPRAKKEAEAE
jgi:large subunit ribosomal protein L30